MLSKTLNQNSFVQLATFVSIGIQQILVNIKDKRRKQKYEKEEEK